MNVAKRLSWMITQSMFWSLVGAACPVSWPPTLAHSTVLSLQTMVVACCRAPIRQFSASQKIKKIKKMISIVATLWKPSVKKEILISFFTDHVVGWALKYSSFRLHRFFPFNAKRPGNSTSASSLAQVKWGRCTDGYNVFAAKSGAFFCWHTHVDMRVSRDTARFRRPSAHSSLFPWDLKCTVFLFATILHSWKFWSTQIEG